MKSLLFLIALIAVIGAMKVYEHIGRLDATITQLRTENARDKSASIERCAYASASLNEQNRQVKEVIDRLTSENENLKRSLTQSDISAQQLHARVVELEDQSRRGAAMAGKTAVITGGRTASAPATAPPLLQMSARDSLIPKRHNMSLRDRFRSNLRVATVSERALVEQLDAQLSSGVTVTQVLADPAIRIAVERSALAQELLAVARNDPESFAQAEAMEPAPTSGTHLSEAQIARIQKLIDQGAKASDLAADPYTRDAARSDPELRALLDEAAKRNGE